MTESDVDRGGPLGQLHDAESLRVSGDARPRALRILHDLAGEAERRGHAIQVGGEVVLAITIGPDRYEFELIEEDDIIDIVPDDEVATKRFAWQRVSPRTEARPSGRLVLRLRRDYRRRSWADRSRWRLEDRLEQALTYIEAEALEAEDRREVARQEAERRRDAWDQAVAEARVRHVEESNRRRMETQLAAWDRARGLRAYAERLVAAVAAETDPGRAARMADWQLRIVAKAEQIDPLGSPDELRFVVPDDIGPAELEPYMPNGMSARRPPDVPN